MPGPFIHISSMKNTAARLARARKPYKPVAGPAGRINPGWAGPDTHALGELMVNAPNFASLGAIGPDLFFFLPDFRNAKGESVSSVLVFVLNTLESLYADVDPYITKYEQYLGPISEDTAEEMSRLTGGLSGVVGDITGELSGILTTFLESWVTSQADFFGFFSLGLDKGWDEKAYFWSDMLHYRDSGQFCRAIWRRADAQGDDQLRAYALGYQTHVATDVTGHAFVNTIAGGPYRMHWQRHHLVENHMDSFWYGDDPLGPKSGDQYPQLTESALYYDVAFGEKDNTPVERPAYPTGNTLRDNWSRQRLLDLDSTLPDSVANLLIGAMGDVWYAGTNANGPHPRILSEDGRPDVQLVKDAYDLFFRYLKYATVDGFNHEPPDPPDLFPNLSFPTISEPGDGSGDSAPGDSSDDGNFWDDLLDFLLSLIRDLAYIVEVAIYLATLPWAVLADLVTYPLRLGLYYALELPLFHLLKSFRQALVMTGFMLPMDDEIAMSLTHIGASSATGFNDLLGAVGDIFGGLIPDPSRESLVPFRDSEYPRSILRDNESPPDPNEYKAPWQYPVSEKELHNVNLAAEAVPAQPLFDRSGGFASTSGPYPTMSTPDILFAGTHQDPAIRERFEAAATPGDADVVGMDVTPTGHLGDSVAFSEYLIWLESRTADDVPLVEWNLDSDMGYGYHCWDWNRRTDAKRNDPNDHPYQLPCTLPEQSEDFPTNTWYQPSTRLKIHWVGPGPDLNGASPLPDPGCGRDGTDGERGRGPNEPQPVPTNRSKGTRSGRNGKIPVTARAKRNPR